MTETTAPSPAKVAATHLYASNGSTDTETKVLVASDAKSVTLRVRMLPGNIRGRSRRPTSSGSGPMADWTAPVASASAAATSPRTRAAGRSHG